MCIVYCVEVQSLKYIIDNALRLHVDVNSNESFQDHAVYDGPVFWSPFFYTFPTSGDGTGTSHCYSILTVAWTVAT